MKSLKINDTVKVIAGNNKGTTAKIVKMDRKNHKAILEGLGLRTRHMKKSYYNPNGGKKDIQTGIELSNLALVEAAKYEKPAVKADKKADKAAKADKAVKADKKADKKAAKKGDK